MKVTRSDQTKEIFPMTIRVDFPEGKFNLVLKKLKLKDSQLLVSDQKRIFLNLIYLFLNGSWSQDELSEVANRFWFEQEEKSSEFATALYECAELTFYCRSIYNIEVSSGWHGNYVEFMLTTMRFYEKYSDEVEVELFALDSK
jgi:hypothetical protein